MEAEFLEQLIAISTQKKAYSDGQKFTTNHFIISKMYYLYPVRWKTILYSTFCNHQSQSHDLDKIKCRMFRKFNVLKIIFTMISVILIYNLTRYMHLSFYCCSTTAIMISCINGKRVYAININSSTS